MTTIAATPLTDSLQSLIDARLDTIDRMLLGRVNRHDRLAIVREVESQIYDLLEGRDAGSLDRDDVLAVLARLDPPEAYLSDEPTVTGSRPARLATRPAPATPAAGRLPLVSGVLGILALTIAGLAWPLAIPLGSEVFLFASAGIALVVGIQAIVFAAMTRLKRAWSVVGLVTGIMSLMILVGMAMLILSGNL